MLQLSAQDAQFLYMESGDNLSHVTSVNIYDPSTIPGGKKVAFKDIIEHIRVRLPVSPFLKRKLIPVPLDLDFPYWADDEHFDLEAHIQHSRLPEPSDWRQFCIHVARYHSRPLNMNRPAWEMYVIEGLSNIEGIPKNAYAIATKVHHAAADGASLERFFGTLLDIDNKGTPCMPLDELHGKPTVKPTNAQMAGRALKNNFSSPIKFLRAVRRTTPGVYKAVQGLIVASRKKDGNGVPATRFNVPIAPHKMFDSVEFKFEDFKALRALVDGCTINDVVLTLLAGALRNYLSSHKELPAEPLHAFVPINARAKGSKQDDKLGNNLATMITPIFTQIEDPVERIQAIFASTSEEKAKRNKTSSVDMSDLSNVIPNATQILASRLILSQTGSFRSCNLFVSNVAGSPVPTYLMGAKQLTTVGLAPLNDGMGLFIAATSYAGKMIFSIVSTRQIMPDIAFFVECIDDSMQELNLALKNTQKLNKKLKSKSKKKPATKKK